MKHKQKAFHPSELVHTTVRHHKCAGCLVEMITRERVARAPKCERCDIYMAPVNCGDDCKKCVVIN